MRNQRCKYDEIPMKGNYVTCPYLKFKIPKGVFTGKMSYICTKDNKNCEGVINDSRL